MSVDRSDPRVQAMADDLMAEIRRRTWDLVTAEFIGGGVDIGPHADVLRVGIEAGIAMTMKTLADRGIVPTAP